LTFSTVFDVGATGGPIAGPITNSFAQTNNCDYQAADQRNSTHHLRDRSVGGDDGHQAKEPGPCTENGQQEESDSDRPSPTYHC